MSRFSGKRIFLGLVILLPLVAGAWIYARRPHPVVMGDYVPESALGYLEVNDWPRVVEKLTMTNAWRELAPGYGVPEKLNYLGQARRLYWGDWGNWVARITGGGEMAILARSQFALAVTALEVREERVKPRLALIAETHSDANALREVAEKRLPQLAEGLFGRYLKQEDEYAGVKYSVWRVPDTDKQLLAAQINGELILANHPDPLRACIDTRLGRAPSMSNNFHLQNSRALVDSAEGDRAAFGFITGEGVTRLLRFWAFLISGDTLSKAALAGAMGDVFTDFSSRAADGIAYGAGFEGGGVVDRYALLVKPEMADALKAAVKPARQNEPNAGERRVLALIPPEAKDVTLISVENPVKALDGIEAVIASRAGAAQSFLLHQFLIGAREAFLGIKANDKADGAIGDEIANFTPAEDSKDRVWLIAQRNEAFINTLVERVFTARGATIAREKYKGREIIRSSDGRRGAAAVLGDYLALGGKERLMRLIDSQQSGRSFNDTARPASAGGVGRPAAVKSFTSVREESGEMMTAIARWTAGRPGADEGAGGRASSLASTGRASTGLDRLPLSASATSIADSGVCVESRSPFGNFPFVVSIIADLVDAK
jgi:hypothetical protein